MPSSASCPFELTIRFAKFSHEGEFQRSYMVLGTKKTRIEEGGIHASLQSFAGAERQGGVAGRQCRSTS